MLEAEVPDKVHFLLDLGAARIIDRRFWRQNIAVVRNCALYSLSSVRALPWPSALSASGPRWAIGLITSYQAPTRLRQNVPPLVENFGVDDEQVEDLAGIFDESKILLHPGVCSMVITMGFRSPRPSDLIGDEGRTDIESDVFSTFSSDSFMPCISSAEPGDSGSPRAHKRHFCAFESLHISNPRTSRASLPWNSPPQ